MSVKTTPAKCDFKNLLYMLLISCLENMYIVYFVLKYQLYVVCIFSV